MVRNVIFPFTSGISTPSNNFNSILNIGSYKVYGAYTNAPNPDCGTNIGTTTSMVGSLNVFRSGVNNWETIQQLFWVLNGVTEQYQRSYNGTAWTIWKRLIKCDDYADTSSRGGIISQANMVELFRAPDIIQIFYPTTDVSGNLREGLYYFVNLDADLSEFSVSVYNGLSMGSRLDLNAARKYRIVFQVHFEILEGSGNTHIGIDTNTSYNYSISEYLDSTLNRTKALSFSIIVTGLGWIKPYISIEDSLVLNISPNYYQISVEEIKFPYYTPNA